MQEQNSQTVVQDQTQDAAKEVRVHSKNFAELRSIAESAREENLQLKQRLAQLEESIKRSSPQKELEEDDEPYVDHKKFRREMGKFEESLEMRIEKKAEEKARAILAEEKKNEYLQRNKDFYEVMQADEIQKFINEHPNIAEKLEKMPDNFDRQQLVYETIKTFKNIKPAQSTTPPVQKSMLAQAFDARKSAMAYQPGGSSGGPFQSMGDFSPSGQKNAYERFKALQKTVNL